MSSYSEETTLLKMLERDDFISLARSPNQFSTSSVMPTGLSTLTISPAELFIAMIEVESLLKSTKWIPANNFFRWL